MSSPRTMARRFQLYVLTLATFFLCSALSSARAQWTEEPGGGWLQVSVFHQDTRRQIGPGVIEIGAHIPLLGRQLPAGPSRVVGYFVTWE